MNVGCEVKNLKERQPQVQEQLGNICYELDILINVSGQLLTKLEPVTRYNQDECCEQKACAPDENLVDLAGRLRGISRNIANVRNNLEDGLRRLEL